jgi:hypothetical protein
MLPPPVLVVVQTYFVTPPPRFDEAPFYEVILAPDLARDAPRTVLITRDETLYDQAVDAEGTDRQFIIRRHPERGSRRTRLVLDALSEVR